MPAAIAQNVLDGKRYLSLETYRKTGKSVQTPVWFAAAPDAGSHVVYVYSGADTGKMKRIRQNPTIRIAPCGARGTVTGPWIDARARFVSGDEFQLGMRLLNRKYRLWKQILDLLFRLKPGDMRVVIAIEFM